MIPPGIRVSSRRRLIAAVTAYAIFLQTFIGAAPLVAQSAPPLPPRRVAAAATAASYSVVLTVVSTGFDAISGIAAYTPSNEVVAAAGGAERDFELIGANGQHRTYSTADGLARGARIATARGEAGPFLAGELFAAADNRIVRISADGATVQSAWATLPAAETITALTVDRGGAFGGDVVAVTAAGNVWRVNAGGTATRIAGIGVALGSVTTLADDGSRHGPWSACILAGAQEQPMLYAVAADGQVTAHQATVVPRDLAVVPAHENFFGVDPADRKVWGAPAEAFAGLVGDVVVAQSAPGVLVRVHWNGSEFESSELARVAQWQQIAFAPAGVAPLKTARRPYDALAVVNHAPVLNSGRIEGALWQLAPESTILDGTDVVTSDLLVPGTPHVAVSGTPAFGGTIEGNGSDVPSTHTISIGGNATLGHLIARTDAITMTPVAAFTPTANTRDAALANAADSPGSFATLRNLAISGKAGAVAVPPGTYGAFSASGRTAFVFGVAGSTTALQYELDSLTLAGGSELRLDGPVVLTIHHGVTLTGATVGAAETPNALVLRLAGGELRVAGKSVLYAVVRAPQSAVIVEGGARLRGTVSCDRLEVSGTIQLTENDVPPPPVNRPPSVDAGADAAVTLPDETTLRGSASDDGLPAGSALTYQWTRVSGPAEVAFAEPQQPVTNAAFTVPGIYVLRLAASDSQLASSDDVTITVDPKNTAPVVNAGADQTIALPSTAALNGEVTDDGYPRGSQLTFTWSGPAGVTFADAHAKATAATFASAGTFTLTLTATDGAETTSDDVTITVDPQNTAPSVNAGADQTIALPSTAALSGEVTDDGYPRGSQLTFTWSGPAGVTFADAHAKATTATFASAGTYTLTLTATDGAGTTSDEVAIVVDPQNAAPSVNAGADQTIALPSTAALNGEVTDDGYPRGSQLTFTWSGPAGVTFAEAHAKATTATFASAGTFTLTLTATDGALTTTDEVAITVDPQNAAPSVNAGADQTIALPSTAALSGEVTDDAYPRGSTLTFTWSGPAGVTFADAHAKATTATFASAGTFTLTLTATDGALTTTDEVAITVDPENTAPVVNAGVDQNIEIPATATLSGEVTDDGYPRGSQLAVTWSGPASVAFADAHAKATTATFAVAGTYTLTLTATDGALTTSDDVTIEVRDPNVAPIVDAGPDQTIRLPQAATLAAQVSDDGNPPGSQLAFTWSSSAGVTFADAHAKNTTAAFSAPGTYVLRITADDSKLQSSDELTVTVLPANNAPVATAGPNQTIVLPNVATLQGSAIDDGVPAPLTYQWTGPAGVTFSAPSAQNTTAAFAVAGTYVLRFTASDGQLSGFAEVTVEVKANQKPVVDAGPDRTANVDDVVTLTGNVTDDGLPSNTLTTQWSVLSGPPPSFTDPGSPVTAVVFKSAGIYVLRLTASDGALTASDDVTIAVVRPPVADFTVPAISRSAARWTNNLASIAAGASLVSDTSNDGNGGALAIDDNPYTRWRSGNGQNKNQSLTIRLAGNGTRPFDRIRLTNDQNLTEAVKNFVMQTSMTTADDAAFTTILTSYLNPSRNTQEIELDASVTAKYVRFVFLDNYGATNMALRDIEVVGTGLGGFDRLGTINVADSAQGAESVAQSFYVRSPSQALDSNNATWWHAGDSANAFTTVRLVQQTRVDRVRLRSGATDGARPKDFKVEVAQDLAGPFTLALTATLANQDGWQEFMFPAGAVRGRFVRLTLLNNYGAKNGCVLNDFQVISADRTSVSSVTSPYQRPELVFDNSVDSLWSPVGIANEWFIVHLTDGEPRLIDAVELQGYAASAGDSIKDFDVYVSDTTDDDAAFRLVASGTVAKSTVMQRFNLTSGPTRARFIKFVAKNNYGGGNLYVPTFHVLTIDHGGNLLTVPGAPPVMTNRSPALAGNGATVIASTGSGVPNMLDYFLGEGWISSGVTNQYATIQLAGGNVYTISGVRLAPSYNAGPSPQNFEVWVSSTTADDSAFTKVLAATATTDPKIQNFLFPGGPVPARYVKYVPLTRYGTSPYIHTGLFDVLMPQHPGGAAGASSTSGFNFPELTLSGNPNLQWVSATNSNEWVKVAMPDSASRAVYGVFIQPSAFAPRDFEIWTSNTTADDSAFSLVYTGFYQASTQIYRFGRYVDAKFVKFLFKTSNSTSPFFIRKLDVLTVPDNGAVVLGATTGTAFNANLETVIDVDGGNGAWGSENPNRTVEQNFTIGLPGAKLWPIDHVAFQQYTPCCPSNAPRDFEIQVSTGDGSDASFVTVYRGTSRGDLTTEHVFFPLVSARAVRLVMHNNWGGTALAIQNFWVFSPQVGPRNARFLDSSVPGARTIVSWAWSFGDGGTSSDRDPVHLFPAPGTYDVALTVTDSDGLSTRRTMQYTVFGDVTADFTISPATPAEQTVAILSDTSTSTNGSILSSEWSFGDGTANNFGKAINHTYLDSGQYTVTHKVADVRGVIATVTRPVTVANVPPIVNAGPDITVPWGQPWNVGAKVSDVVVDNTTITCHWDFGDGTSADVTDCAKNAAVVHKYPEIGTFNATLTATDKDGGTASDSVVTTTTKRPSMIVYGGSRGVAVDGTISLAAVLRDGISHDLLAGTVTFDVSGQTVTATTDAGGRATATLVYTGIMNPPTVTVRYDGDARYTGSTSSATLSCPADQQPLDVAQVIDLSGSMDTAVPDAKVAFIDLLDSLIPGRDRAATIVFADSAEIRQPLTTDLDAARKGVDTFATFGGGTQIASGIYAGMSELTSTRHNPAAQPVLVLFSDGGDSGFGVKVAADQAKAAGIRIISIGYKNSNETSQVMAPLASSPSDYYEITTASQLEPLFLSLPGTLCTAPNAAPVVSAGAAQTVALPATTFTLKGTAVDDGKPAGSTLTYQWTKVSGPGNVTFSAPTSIETTATITVAGTYVVRLTASDGLLSASGDTACILKPENQAPVVNAGPDLTATIENELLQNTGAEAALVNGKLPSWTEVAGTWTASSTAVEPFRGTQTFVSSGPSATEMIQDVDVTSFGGTIEGGQQQFTWTVFVRVANETVPDAAKIIVEYRGVNNASVLKSVSTDDVSPTGLWERVTSTDVAPKGTRVIRIRLIAARHSGTTNDVWFDAVSLRAVGAGATRLLASATDDQLPSSSLFINWTQTSGPVSGIFNSFRADAHVTVITPGLHTYRITANDTEKSTSDDVSVTALAANAAPVVSAGADATVQLPADATLSATATDESTSLAYTWSFLSGPLGSAIAQPHAASTSVAFASAGTYVFRVYADDGDRVGVDEVTITVTPPAGNQAPVVNAGADLVVTDPPRTATLSGSATDDGLPENASLTYAWSTVSGPGNAQFAAPSQPVTTVTFPAVGTYVLRLSCSDTNKIGTDDITVTVVTNKPPVVNAGEDVVFNDSQPVPRLLGTATDNDIPPGGALTYSWTRVSGPGNATIATPTQLVTSIALSAHGRHVFRLTATDGQLSARDDVAITWDGPNAAPTVNAGVDRTITLPNTAALDATITDDGLPVGGTLSYGWSRVSGPADVQFANPGAASTTATFTAAGDYVLRITVTDGESTASDDVAITVKDAVPAPVVEITSPDAGATITDRTVFRGSVSADSTWRLEYRLNANDAAAGTNAWQTIATGTGPLTNAPLGTFDPTLLLNGTYKVRLSAIGGDGQTSATSIAVTVEGALKLGIFTLSFRDLTVPLPGLSLDVDRGYDSRDTRAGDFGFGWKLETSTIRVEKSGVIGASWQETVSGVIPAIQYCIAPLFPRYVTVTFPNEKVYRFAAVASPQCQPIAPIQTPTITFVPVGKTRGTLTADGGSDVMTDGSIPGTVNLVTSDVVPYNPTLFRLTTELGVTYVIDETKGLQQIIDRAGNKLTVSRDGIVHSTGRGVTFTRDTAGRITAITDPEGKSRTYGYDANGDLATATDATGRTTRFTYDAAHHLVSYSDPANRLGVRTDYDASGRMIAMTDANGKVTKFDFDLGARQQVITDRRGNPSVFVYDARGNTLSITNSDGKAETATYDADGRMLTHTDRLGRTNTYVYDARGNLLTATDAASHITTYTWNDFDQVTSATDPNGHVKRLTYDAAGNLTRFTDAMGHEQTFTFTANGLPLTSTDAAGHTTTFEYDAFGNRTKVTDPRGHSETFTYDRMGRETSRTDAYGHTAAGTYDEEGRLLTVTDAKGNVSRNEYDAAGNLAAMTDGNGIRTETVADAKALPQSTKLADGTTWSLSYDADDSLSGTAITGQAAFAYTRDASGHPTRMTVGGNVVHNYVVDAAGRRTGETDPLGHASSFTYDIADNLTSSTDPLGNTIRMTYDPAGLLTSVTDPNGNTLHNVYDDADRLTEQQRPDGGRIRYTYDDAGNVTSVSDALGNPTSFTRNGMGSLTSVTEPTGAVTSLDYDDEERITAVKDANDHTLRFTYDEVGRRSAITYPDGKTETLGYDQLHLTSRKDRAGQQTTFDYDARGLLSGVHYPDGTTAQFTRSAIFKLTGVSSPAGTASYEYDNRGNVVRQTKIDGSVLSFTYDDADNRKTMTTPAGTTSYAYDEANRLTSVTDPHGHVTRYTYDKRGNVVRIDHPNGAVTTREYDAMSRVRSVTTVDRQGSVLFGETYEFDLAGNRTEIDHADGSSATFEYDVSSRLVSENYWTATHTLDRRIAYTYDAVGNRSTRTDTGDPAGRVYQYSANDEMLSDGVSTFAYDANGSLIGRDTAGVQTTFTYDGAKMLTGVTQPGGTATHTYDGLGRRIASTDHGVTTRYVVDDAQLSRVVADVDDANHLAASYVYGHELLSENTAAGESFYIYDGTGSVRALVDANGVVTDRYDYDAFGQLTFKSGSTPNRFLYRGQEYDASTGLYHLRARYYDPNAGRFITMDRVEGFLEAPATRHRYVYALNNPVNRHDPSGEQSSWVACLNGTSLHGKIGAEYASYAGCWDGDILNGSGVAANIWIQGITPELIQAGLRSKKSGGMGVQPDLRHYRTGEVHEIKPLSNYGVPAAAIQALSYSVGLNMAEWKVTGIFWYPGTYMYKDPGHPIDNYEVHGPAGGMFPGTIIYSKNWNEDLKDIKDLAWKAAALSVGSAVAALLGKAAGAAGGAGAGAGAGELAGATVTCAQQAFAVILRSGAAITRSIIAGSRVLLGRLGLAAELQMMGGV